MSETMEPTPASDLILYQTEDGKTRIQCRFEDESIWLTQAQIAELFQTTPQNITQHIRSIYEENELDETATCKSYLQVRVEGARQVKRQLNHYSLPLILAVGFRVLAGEHPVLPRKRHPKSRCLEEGLRCRQRIGNDLKS